MAYTKTDWKCGDIITNAKLNNMENGISANDTAITAHTSAIADNASEIEGCISAIQNLQAEVANIDVGYECATQETLLFEETGETSTSGGYQYPRAELHWHEDLNYPTLKIVLDSIEYICPLTTYEVGGETTYAFGAPVDVTTGEIDFSVYPFVLTAEPEQSGTILTTSLGGTYVISVSTFVPTTTECFKEAVKSVVGEASPLIVNVNRFDDPITADKTFAGILEAYNGCRPIYINLRPVIGFMATEDSEGDIYSLDLTTLDASISDSTLYFDTYSVSNDNNWSYTSRGVDAQ